MAINIRKISCMNPGGKKKIITLLSGIIASLFMAIVAMIFLEKNSIDSLETKNIHVNAKATVILNGMTQVSQKNGITQWELSAESASLIQKENKALLQKINVTFYTKDRQKIFLTADQGQLDTTTHDMSLEKNVIIKHGTNIAKTHSLHYEKKKHIIHTNSEIKLTNEDSLIRADSMIITLTDNTLILSGHVKGKLYEHFNKP